MDPTDDTRRGMLARIGPGLLIAATGVGAGDLAGAGFAGSRLGLGVLWAVILGAALKYAITEGMARFQVATGRTWIEGVRAHLGHVATVALAAYVISWCWFVGLALLRACAAVGEAVWAFAPGVTVGGTGIRLSTAVYAASHAAAAGLLVLLGGFRWVERLMAGAVAVMAATVLGAAAMSRPDLAALGAGLIPGMPSADGGLAWTVALIGGVGGTLTIACYGYWIREHGMDRRPPADALAAIRADLLVGYGFTALFGIAMIIIAAPHAGLDGGGAGLLTRLADAIGITLGPAGKWLFLAGAWAAVFSSVLGVFEGVPRIVEDVTTGRAPAGARPGLARRLALLGLMTLPLLGLFVRFDVAVKLYGIYGSLFVPAVAASLLVLNRRRIAGNLRNRPLSVVALVAALAVFAAFAAIEIAGNLRDLAPR